MIWGPESCARGSGRPFYAHGRCENVLPEARATFWRQFVCLDPGGLKVVFLFEESEILGPKVVELP